MRRASSYRKVINGAVTAAVAGGLLMAGGTSAAAAPAPSWCSADASGSRGARSYCDDPNGQIRRHRVRLECGVARDQTGPWKSPWETSFAQCYWPSERTRISVDVEWN